MPGRRPSAGDARLAVIGFAVAVVGLALAVTVALRNYATQYRQAERLRVVCDSLRVELTHAQQRSYADSLTIAGAHLAPAWVRELQGRRPRIPAR